MEPFNHINTPELLIAEAKIESNPELKQRIAVVGSIIDAHIALEKPFPVDLDTFFECLMETPMYSLDMLLIIINVELAMAMRI
jgi:hypothetical protein